MGLGIGGPLAQLRLPEAPTFSGCKSTMNPDPRAVTAADTKGPRAVTEEI